MGFKFFIATVLLLVPHLDSQVPPADENLSANDLVRHVVDNELRMQEQDHSHWMYRLETEKAGVKETKEVVETKDGDLTRLVARNDQPLTDEQQKEEDDRMQKFIHAHEEQQKQQQAEDEDIRKGMQLLALLPDAFTFSYMTGNGDGDIVTLNFKPNPAFHPPSREAHVFHEMEGELTVNRKEKRLIEMKGRLMKDVKFGGGILGHLEQGGTFDVRQEEVAPNHWEITQLKVNMKGKALFFKTISVQQNELRDHFERVSDTLTLSQAADSLLKQVAIR
jgi:hypothetical protein